MAELRVGVLGASSLVGRCVLPQLRDAGWQVVAYTRQVEQREEPGVLWQALAASFSRLSVPQNSEEATPYWICVAPIWVLPEYFQMLESYGVRKVVTLSSTSRFTKDQSSDLEEQQIAKRLADAESQVESWAEQRGIEWVILRPTLIYGHGRDKNIAEMVRLIRRFGFFPLFGKAQGLRQPIHAEDVAVACVSALQSSSVVNRAFNISGAETLTYRDMVTRVFVALGRQPRLLTVPLWAFRMTVSLVRLVPRYQHWSAAMAERMNRDLVFDHADATHAFDFKPKGFVLSQGDLP